MREWLSAQAASGFVDYRRRHSTPSRCRPSRRRCSPTRTARSSWPAASPSLSAVYHDEPKLAEAFKSGKGLHWGEHCNCLFCGVERFFRPGYRAHLVAEWLPALDGVVEKLERGAKVADVGCGHGASTHADGAGVPELASSSASTITTARSRMPRKQANGTDERPLRGRRARRTLPASGFDLVTMFDALHDMGDPVGAVAHIRTDAQGATAR